MRKLWGILMLSVLMMGVISVSQAQSGSGAKEDPAENACYAGGALEGKCDWPTEAESEWAWNCGYYYAQYQRGLISASQAPSWCGSMFPALWLNTCIAVGPDSVRLVGDPNVPGNASYYPSPDCSGAASSLTLIWMQTSAYVSYERALELCSEANSSTSWDDAYQISGSTLSGFNFICISGLLR
jgi:hypothetical protein